MTRIDFYLNAESKLHFACRIAAKALRQKLRINVYSCNELVTRSVDGLMWSTPPTSFLPHCLEKNPLSAETPIIIGEQQITRFHSDLLINLELTPPPQFERYVRLVEIVSRDDEIDQKSARDRYRFYKDRGYPLLHHDLTHFGPGTRSER